MATKWYWANREGGERNGPVSRENLKGLVQSGKIGPEDLVWRNGFSDWKAAGKTEELKGLFSGPPPLPDEPTNGGEDQWGSGPPRSEASVGDSSSEAVGSERTPSVEGIPSESDAAEGVPLEEKISEKDLSSQRGSSRQEEEEEMPDLPVEFAVNWEGSIWSEEATLRLTEEEITLRCGDDVGGGNVKYDHVQVRGHEGKTVKVWTPGLFINDGDKDDYVVPYNLIFESKESKKKFLDVHKKSHSEDRFEEEVDTRYWYNSKRIGVFLWFILWPVILWNGYAKLASKETEWFDHLLPLSVQSIWFPPIGWYGIFKTSRGTTSTKIGGAVLASLLFYFAGEYIDLSGQEISSGSVAACEKKEGVYSGSYLAQAPSGGEKGSASLALDGDCTYGFSMDGSKMGNGKATPLSGGEFELENGTTVRISGSVARMVESKSTYTVKYVMEKVE
jgi:hypothetical protein